MAVLAFQLAIKSGNARVIVNGQRSQLPTKAFTFFCFMLVFALPIEIPGFSFGVLIVPLVYLVSGRKYALLYMALAALFDSPYIIQSLIRLVTLWPTFITPMLEFEQKFNAISSQNGTAKADFLNSVIQNSSLPSSLKEWILHVPLPQQHQGHSSSNLMLQAIIQGIAFLSIIPVIAILYFLVRGLVRDVRLYYNVLKRAANAAKNHHN